MDILSGQALFMLFSLFLSCFVIFSTIKSRLSSLRTTAPGPPRLPIIGNIHQVGKNPHRSFADLSKTYGPIMSIKFGSLYTVVITSPEAAKEVLRTHDQVLSGRTPNNAVRSNGHHEVSVAWLPSSSPRWSYDSKMSNGFHDTMTGVVEAIAEPDLANYFPFLGFLDLQGDKKKIKVFTKMLFKVFREFIDAKIAEKSSRSKLKDVSDFDFLDAILSLTEGDEAELDIKDIEHLLCDLFVAGTDTSSVTVEWAMAELLRNPMKMAKVQDEMDRVIGQKGVAEESDISELPYLQAVVKETFRLHPAGPFLVPRKAEADMKVLGFLVPKDTQVLVNVWAIRRDPKVWENPTWFEPERFLGKEIDVKGKDYEFTPFGAGRRICPGLPLAMKTVSLILASLLYSFDWKLPNDSGSEDLDMDETFGLTLHKTNRLHAIPVKKRVIQ